MASRKTSRRSDRSRRARLKRNARLLPIDMELVDELAEGIAGSLRACAMAERSSRPPTIPDGTFIFEAVANVVDTRGRPVEVLIRACRTNFASMSPVSGDCRWGKYQDGSLAAIVTVKLSSDFTWTFLATPTIISMVRSTLAHEMTHAMEATRPGKAPYRGEGNVPTSKWLKWYGAVPHEVRARMRQVYMEIRPEVLVRLGRGEPLGSAISASLEGSVIWKYEELGTGRAGLNTLLKGVVTAFEDEGFGG